MNKPVAFTAMLGMVLSASAVASAATTPPKVVFIGDFITYDWSSGFAAHSNWINKGGSASVAEFGNGSSSAVLARFQSDVVSLHPAIVHIMIGEGDADATDDGSFQLAVPQFLSNLTAIVQQAKAANIQVILGLEPSVLTYAGQIESMNAVVASFGAANNIPVINYADGLCGCVSSVELAVPQADIGNDVFGTYGGGPYIVPAVNPGPFSPHNVVSATGYNLMTQMALNAISTLNLTLKAGYLQNVQEYNDNVTTSGPPGPVNVNTVYPGAILQFTPVGQYSDGSYHSLLNTTFDGASGTWTSSNPEVVYINQRGTASANSQGTATIRYTPANGVKFSEWIMYVNAPQG